MKHILLIPALFSLITSAYAQYGMRLEGSRLKTDQAGVIFITTAQTNPKTMISFSQIFQCLKFEGTYCQDYADETISHEVEMIFLNTPVAVNDFYNFYIVYDLEQKSFKLKMYSRSNPGAEYLIDSSEERSVIIIDN